MEAKMVNRAAVTGLDIDFFAGLIQLAAIVFFPFAILKENNPVSQKNGCHPSLVRRGSRKKRDPSH